MAIRTIYEISKPSYKFYSVERAGFTSVTEMASSAITDCLQLGSFTLSNVHFVHTVTNARVDAVSWPVLERTVVPTTEGTGPIPGGGLGYRVGDRIVVPGPFEANLAMTVATTHRGNGTVRTLTITNAGDQRQLPDAEKATAWPIPARGAVGTYTTTFTCQGNVQNNASSAPTVIAVDQRMNFVYTQSSITNFNIGAGLPWVQAFGIDGSGGRGTRPPAAALTNSANPVQSINDLPESRHPLTGFWAFIKFDAEQIYVGQEVILRTDDTFLPDPTSVIPPNTYITKVNAFRLIDGLRQSVVTVNRDNPDASTFRFVEKTGLYCWMETNNPITVRRGDPIGLRGSGLVISDEGTKLPAGFTCVLQSGGAVDPLTDTVGVFGNVAQTTNNSKYVTINNMVTENTYNPYLYAGQEVTSTNPFGTIGPAVDKDAVTVVGVNPTGPTSANVELSEPITFSQAGESLHFVFGDPQPWRICFEVVQNTTNPAVGAQTLNVYAGTALQLTDTGSVSRIWNMTGTSVVDRAGMLGARPTGTDGAPNPLNPIEGFLNREKRVGKNPEVYPLNYQLTLTDRGMFFGLWEGSWSVLQKTKARSTSDKDAYFNWFVIQRPVNRYTGVPLTVGRCPVFCINSVGYKYWKFVVREEDILHPQQGDPDNQRDYIDPVTSAFLKEATPYRVPADAHTQDSYAILNTTNQISLTEDSKYLISFVHNLTSPRFRYSEEIDMIGQTSADVCMSGNDLSITAYNESGPRIYRALPANNPYNTGLRVCALRNVTWLGE